jgi:hypothetical protein
MLQYNEFRKYSFYKEDGIKIELSVNDLDSLMELWHEEKEIIFGKKKLTYLDIAIKYYEIENRDTYSTLAISKLIAQLFKPRTITHHGVRKQINKYNLHKYKNLLDFIDNSP